MIIVRSQARRRGFRSPLRLLLVLAGLAGIVLLLNYATQEDEVPAKYSCDAETRKFVDGVEYFAGDGMDFMNGFTQDSTYARSGRYSCRIDKSLPFGMTFRVTDLRPGERFDATIWRRKGAEGTLVAQGSWGLYESFPELTGIEDGEWEQLRMSFLIPESLFEGELKIYPWNAKVEPGWFDDFEIRRTIRSGNAFSMPGNLAWKPEKVNLVISEKGMKKLETKRLAAMSRGILFSEDDDYVKARLESGKRRARGKVRLKGDWTDHLMGNKWSFRVNLAQGESWNRMVVFSFQNPQTRSFLHEWVYHRMLEREDILTTRYDLIELAVNGVSRGVFAYEEHFVKQLPEYHKRREGPIIKMNEEGFWEMMDRARSEGGIDLARRLPIQQASDIEAFGLGRTLKDEKLAAQFQHASTLLDQYRNGTASCDEIFDRDRLARYFALVDVNQAYHGFIWHNLRFYYNPVLSRLEPIGFDGYTKDGPLKWMNRPFIGYGRQRPDARGSFEENLYDRFFADEAFLTAYIGYLYEFTSDAYISSFFRALRGDIEKREELIRAEFPAYTYDYQFIPMQARALRNMILPLTHTSVKANQMKAAGDMIRIQLRNFHCLPVDVIGTANSDGGEVSLLPEKVRMAPHNPSLPPDYREVDASEGDWLAFRIPGIDSVFYSPIKPFALPGVSTPAQELFRGVQPESNALYSVDSTWVKFKPGAHEIDTNLVFPAGYEILIPSGTDLNFVRGAMFVSKSPVHCRGTESEPVRVRSSDGSMRGFTVLQAPKQSTLYHTVFDGLNTLDHQGWVLTGAVTFYESDVSLKNIRIINNHCEDALNTVRSHFYVKDCMIGFTFGDGFDSDFCSGDIYNMKFIKTGNDAIDFSGSEITIHSIEIDEAGDKGISVGEESTVTLGFGIIRNSPLGVASKDLSRLNIDMIRLENVEQGFAAYQKKPEYGPGYIVVKKYEAEDVDQLYRLQMDSELDLEGKVIVGKI